MIDEKIAELIDNIVIMHIKDSIKGGYQQLNFFVLYTGTITVIFFPISYPLGFGIILKIRYPILYFNLILDFINSIGYSFK